MEGWDRRRAEVLERLNNGNGMGEPLAIAAKRLGMWPTPLKGDAGQAGMAPSQIDREGVSLSTAVHLWSEAELSEQVMWPTPQGFDAREFQRSGSATAPNGGEKNLREVAVRWRSSPRRWKRSASGGPSSETSHTSPQLWPTPTRRDERTGWTDSEKVVTRQGPTLSDVATTLTESQLLNPRFEEWLLGIPINYADALSPIDADKFARWEIASSLLVLHSLGVSCGSDSSEASDE